MSSKALIEVRSITIGDQSFQLLIPDPTRTEAGSILVEPVTWAWVGLKIAEGVLGAIGAKIFNDMFGPQSATKQDLVAALRAFVDVVALVIRQEIQREEMAKLEASAGSLQSLFRMYLNNNDVDYLLPLVFKANELVYQSARFKFRTIAIFAVVGGLELVILKEVFRRSNKPGDRKNIGQRADDLIASARELRPSLIEFNASRFHPDLQRTAAGYFYGFDGRPYLLRTQNEQEAIRLRQQHISAEQTRLEVEILHPFYPHWSGG